MKLQSYSSEKTKEIGADTAKKILEKGPGEKAVVIGLKGDLGAGKTTFIQGFFEGLGSKTNVLSPTFIIMRRTKLPPKRKFSDIFHIDSYRLKTGQDLAMLGLLETIENPKNIVLIEWAERVKEVLPKNILWIEFEYGEKENERTITIK